MPKPSKVELTNRQLRERMAEMQKTIDEFKSHPAPTADMSEIQVKANTLAKLQEQVQSIAGFAHMAEELGYRDPDQFKALAEELGFTLNQETEEVAPVAAAAEVPPPQPAPAADATPAAPVAQVPVAAVHEETPGEKFWRELNDSLKKEFN